MYIDICIYSNIHIYLYTWIEPVTMRVLVLLLRPVLIIRSAPCGQGVRGNVGLKDALCAQAKRLRVSYNQNDKTLSRNSLRYLSKANLTIAFN